MSMTAPRTRSKERPWLCLLLLVALCTQGWTSGDQLRAKHLKMEGEILMGLDDKEAIKSLKMASKLADPQSLLAAQIAKLLRRLGIDPTTLQPIPTGKKRPSPKWTYSPKQKAQKHAYHFKDAAIKLLHPKEKHAIKRYPNGLKKVELRRLP